MDYEKKIEIPFGAHDSELKGWEYTIPEGMEAIIKDGKVLVREKESEDERMRKMLIDRVRSAEELTDELREWILTYLEKHKEQKPAEWSEEDEERIQSILFSIGYCKDEYPNKKDYSKDIDWLKSLRPSWKPSDEQMQCSLAVITNQYNAGAESCHLTLGSLYNDLKKLI